MKIKFNKPLLLGTEIENLKKLYQKENDDQFVLECQRILQQSFSCRSAQLTSSCTAAMEMIVKLLAIDHTAEIIMPSFTQVGTANPFMAVGAKIKWCDIRPDTKNIDENLIELQINSRTKALVIVHYAGIACELEAISKLCKKHNIYLIEDCAMSIGSSYEGNPLGSFGDFAVVSFHETKNVHCSVGGALLINNDNFIDPAESLINCGTNRKQFESDKTDHYSWIRVSSNYQMSKLQAAFLLTQLQKLAEINSQRRKIWNYYFTSLMPFLESDSLPFVPDKCDHNGHLFYLTTQSESPRNELICFMESHGIETVFHYIPLHNAPIWKGKTISLPITEIVASTILRLPLYFDLRQEEQDLIIQKLIEFKIK